MPVQAVRRSAPENDPRRFLGLHIRDMSRGGIGAVSQEMLSASESLVLFFPPLGPGRGRDAQCQVVRCIQRDDHFAVGIAFEEPWPEREDVRTY